jgi:hypothetical protein
MLNFSQVSLLPAFPALGKEVIPQLRIPTTRHRPSSTREYPGACTRQCGSPIDTVFRTDAWAACRRDSSVHANIHVAPQLWALYCLVYFYYSTKGPLAPIKPIGATS